LRFEVESNYLRVKINHVVSYLSPKKAAIPPRTPPIFYFTSF